MESKTVFSVLRFVADALAVGTALIVLVVMSYLFQRERAKELVAEILRAVKRDSSQ
jgi:hypothetical protein